MKKKSINLENVMYFIILFVPISIMLYSEKTGYILWWLLTVLAFFLITHFKDIELFKAHGIEIKIKQLNEAIEEAKVTTKEFKRVMLFVVKFQYRQVLIHGQITDNRLAALLMPEIEKMIEDIDLVKDDELINLQIDTIQTLLYGLNWYVTFNIDRSIDIFKSPFEKDPKKIEIIDKLGAIKKEIMDLYDENKEPTNLTTLIKEKLRFVPEEFYSIDDCEKILSTYNKSFNEYSNSLEATKATLN